MGWKAISTQQEVFDAADKLASEGKEVTANNLLIALGGGIAKGAEVNVKATPGQSTKPASALMEAARAGNPEVVAFFIKHGAAVNVRRVDKGFYCNGYTPLAFAVSAGNLAAAKVLISNNADVDLFLPTGKHFLCLQAKISMRKKWQKFCLQHLPEEVWEN